MATFQKVKWDKKSLSQLGFIGRGKSKHRPRNDKILYGGKYPFIQTSDIKNSNFYVNSFSQTYNEVGLNQSKLWEKNTLCMTIAANIAETAILKFQACFPDSIVGFVAESKNCNVKFIKYALDFAKKNFQKTAKGTAQDNLSLEKIERLKIPTPDIDTQNLITKLISSYDDLIENNEKRIKVLEEMAQLLYEEWFVRFKFPRPRQGSGGQAGHEKVKMVDSGTEFGMIPEGWEVKKLIEIGKAVTGKTPPTSKQENYNGEVLFIKTPDIHGNIFVIKTEQTLSEIGAKTQHLKLLPEKTVFVSCIGTLGVVGITSRPSQTNQQINALVLDNSFDYCMFYFFAKNLKQKLIGLGANGATMGNVNKGKFEKIEIIYPDEAVRKGFYNKTNILFDEIHTLQKQNTNLSNMRDLLTPQLVTGKRKLK